MIPQENPPSDDLLSIATEALRQTAVPGAPPLAALDAVLQIPRRDAPVRRTPFMLAAAGFILCLAVLAVYFLLQHSATVAFADVVQTIDQTHGFTATYQTTGGMAASPACRLSASADSIRFDSPDDILIINQLIGKALELRPSRHQIVTNQTIAYKFNLYDGVRDYQNGHEKPLGSKVINSHPTQGFQLIRPSHWAEAAVDHRNDETWTFWIDPASKLPVEIEIFEPNTKTTTVISDLHFDVPLDAALFDTKIPAGFTAAGDLNTGWERFHYAGQVIDQHGQPLPGVTVSASCREDAYQSLAYAPIGEMVTDHDGRFAIDASLSSIITRNVGPDWTSPIRLEFSHPDHLFARLEDVHLLSPDVRDDLLVRLRDGNTLTGSVSDPAGNPVVGALVKSILGRNHERSQVEDMMVRNDYRKAVLTDGHGRFELHGLPSALAEVLVTKITKQGALLCATATADLRSGAPPQQLILQPLDLGKRPVHEILGMKLVEIDPDLQRQLQLYFPDGVLVLSPGSQLRMMSGRLIPGAAFFIVGDKRIRTFHDFAAGLSAECQDQKQRGLTPYRVRVVYDFSQLEGDGSMTTMLYLSDHDLLELQMNAQ